MRINSYRRSTVHAMTMAFGLLAPLAAFGQASPPAQVASRFAGNWVEDQSQRKTGAERSLTFRNGPKGLVELRGSYSRPLVEPVRFGAAPYAFGEPNATMEWKQLGNGRFERTMMENGKTVETRQITVSPDGTSLTEIEKRNLADGKQSTTTEVYARLRFRSESRGRLETADSALGHALQTVDSGRREHAQGGHGSRGNVCLDVRRKACRRYRTRPDFRNNEYQQDP
jgi:hypothetical protein